MRQIPLTYGCESKTGKFAVVDDADFELACKYRWYLTRHHGKLIVRANVPGHTSQAVYLHRLISGAKPGEVAILVDRDPLNCTRRNVVVGRRDLVAAGRAPRRAKRNDGRSKGTTWRPQVGKWQARHRIDGREYSLGYFETEEEAGRAFEDAAEAHFGPIAHRSSACELEPTGSPEATVSSRSTLRRGASPDA